MTGPPKKRQKREAYHQQVLDAAGGAGGDGRPIELPKKKFYRQRAHANPFSDHALTYPASPAEMDWSKHFPAFVDPQAVAALASSPSTSTSPPPLTKQVEIADIGCGFGGLLVALSPLFPQTLMLGMELRTQVLDYVTNRIAALRSQHSSPSTTTTNTSPPPAGPYQNISALRTNTMKFLPNYFVKGQLTHLFLCFPDPHFKSRKHKARIVSAQLNAEYGFAVRPGGCVYTVTDVEELHGWIVRHFEDEAVAGGGRELWERVSLGEGGEVVGVGGVGVGEGEGEQGDEETTVAKCVKVMMDETEEGKKVSRNGGSKFVAVWRRREDPAWPA